MDQNYRFSPTLLLSMLDHDLLIAGIAVRQASTHTAAIAQRIGRPEALGDRRSALVALFSGGDDRAGEALRGSFHPQVALAAGKARSILMKSGFTLAF